MFDRVTFSDFTARFHRMDRGNQFSHQALQALFDYLEALEEDTGESIGFDCIALCCEYTEYENLEEFQSNYGILPDKEDFDDLEDWQEAAKEEIKDHTTLIEIPGTDGFIIQNF